MECSNCCITYRCDLSQKMQAGRTFPLFVYWTRLAEQPAPSPPNPSPSAFGRKARLLQAFPCLEFATCTSGSAAYGYAHQQKLTPRCIRVMPCSGGFCRHRIPYRERWSSRLISLAAWENRTFHLPWLMQQVPRAQCCSRVPHLTKSNIF